MVERLPRVGAQRLHDPLTEATRPVGLYRVQTVARPMLPIEPGTTEHATHERSTPPADCRAQDPPTRCYPSGVLAQLHGKSDARSREPPTVVQPSMPIVSEHDRTHARSPARAHLLTLSRRAAAFGAACAAAAITLAVLVHRLATPARDPNAHDLSPPADRAHGSLATSQASANAEHGDTTTGTGTDADTTPDQRSALAESAPPTPAVAGVEPRRIPRPASRGRPPSPRAAAELLARGHYPEALEVYLQLAQAHRDRSVYAHVAALIERRWTERCAQASAAGEPCVAAGP
jgi:hypothetical protein